MRRRRSIGEATAASGAAATRLALDVDLDLAFDFEMDLVRDFDLVLALDLDFFPRMAGSR
jgi:hypothetical protein